MSILFGHPTGNPNSHQAALAHFESGRLEAFCVPWMPTRRELEVLKRIPTLENWTTRLERRSFSPLLEAPLIEGRIGEWMRMAKRFLSNEAISSEALAYDANDWLMKTMSHECARPTVTAVHSYEDCSLLQFQEAKKRGKTCIYDMPIGYYPAWEETQNRLMTEFGDWLPSDGPPSKRYVRPAQKKKEMELADLVLTASSFTANTVSRFQEKRIAVARYGVDSDFWRPAENVQRDGPLRFIYVGHCSIRKGTPVLLQAWKNAGLKDSELLLIGPWQLADKMRSNLPKNVTHVPPQSRINLREFYQSSDVFVFPSFFEGFGLVLLEAMACGLPVLASEATAAPDIVDGTVGKVIPAGDVNQWSENLREICVRRDELPQMKKAARRKACGFTWKSYREAVSVAVKPFC